MKILIADDHAIVREGLKQIIKTLPEVTLIDEASEGNEALLKRIDDEGHLIGTHSYTHSYWFDLYSAKRMKNELVKSEEALFKIIGKKPLLFRPPYGVINPMLKKALGSFSYQVIGYSNRSLDTVTKDEKKTLERLIRKLQPGDIVLLHESVPYATSLLKKFLYQIAEKGYIVVGLDELLNIQPYDE